VSILRALRSASSDRFPVLGSVALRPVRYGGTKGGIPFPLPTEPIAGLVCRSAASPQVALFHLTTNCYGLLDLAPGPHRLLVSDPRGRYLPRATAATLPDREPLRQALARGASSPPIVPPPPLLTVPLRPVPGSPLRGAETAFWGRVLGGDGRPLPLAWIRVTTAQGVYITHSDMAGDYLAPLPFLAPQLPGGDDDDVPVVEFPATVRVHALKASPAPGSAPLDVLPADFDALVPGTPDFEAVYAAVPVTEADHDITVGTQPRLDLQP